MENEILKNMDGFELLDTLKATVRDIDFADDFAQVYEEILNRARNTKDLSILLKSQNLRWEQLEYLTQQWLENYQPPTLTHDARYA